MIKIKFRDIETAFVVAKRMLFFVYERSSPLQASATENEVWARAWSNGDDPGGRRFTRKGVVSADYVFGRPLKVYFEIENEHLIVDDRFLELAHEAILSTGKEEVL